MKLFAVAAFLASVVLSSVAADGATAGSDGKTWGYQSGNPSVYGPSEWAAHYPHCAGKRQSPIDITFKSACEDGQAKKSSPLEFSGECSEYKLKQTHDVYKGEVQGGSCSVRAKGKAYSMLQFHMHAPAEHTLNGKAYDAEAHFVHSAGNGSSLLVVGVFMQKKHDAKTDPWLAKVWSTLGDVNSTAQVPVKLGSYASLLAETASKGLVFNYPGSLTTPTCDEIVDWWVLQTPLQVSAADFDKFQKHLEKLPATDHGRGARPTQPLNGRTVAIY